jgi:hypothetical protein
MGAGQSSGAQDQVLPGLLPADTFEAQRDPAAVAPDQILTRPSAGPAYPTGTPCVCAWRWSEAADGTITVEPADTVGLATGFRGAPVFMTWCVVCGGERDGQFRPDNAIKYGPLPEEEAQQLAPTVEEITERVMERMVPPTVTETSVDAITERVLSNVASYLSSDAFISALAAKLTPQRSATKRA